MPYQAQGLYGKNFLLFGASSDHLVIYIGNEPFLGYLGRKLIHFTLVRQTVIFDMNHGEFSLPGSGQVQGVIHA